MRHSVGIAQNLDLTLSPGTISRPDVSGNDFRTVAIAALVRTPSTRTSTTAVKIGQRLMRRTVKL